MPAGKEHSLGLVLRESLSDRVYALLKQAGKLAQRQGETAFVVGGFIRDLLLGRPNLDLDIVIEGDGIAYARALARELHATVKVHDRFGTAVVLFPDGFKLDVATARRERYEHPAALPTVVRSSIKEDLSRRDFTINTLAIRLNPDGFGELVDFYNGRRDLTAKTIRVLHRLSFSDDPTRIFRALRFEHRFGFHLGTESLTLIKEAAKRDLIGRLSGSRLLNEVIRLFSEDKPRRAIARMDQLGLLRFLHPSLKWSARLDALLKRVEEALDWYRTASLTLGEVKVGAGGARVPVAPPNATGDGPLSARMEPWVVYFSALMEAEPEKDVRETLKRLRVPEQHAEKIRDGHFTSGSLLRRLARRPPLTAAETYRTLASLSDETLLLLIAKTKSQAVKRRISTHLTTYLHVKPVLTGADLKALGAKPGPMYKKILDRLLDARLNGDIATEADERKLLKKLAK